MFWLKQLTNRQDSDESSWAVSYGDLMSLLLAVFVIIAVMSDLHAGERFDAVSGAVRSAFGFPPFPVESNIGARTPARPLTLLERLEQSGLRPARPLALDGEGVEEEVEVPCEIIAHRDRIEIRIAGSAAFEPFSARLQPGAERLVGRLAEHLRTGQARLEVRGHHPDGPLPPEAPFRDGLDLSYERARVVTQALTAGGVSRTRVYVTACRDDDPIVVSSVEADADGADRRVEIIVHAVSAAAHNHIAEKERVSDG